MHSFRSYARRRRRRHLASLLVLNPHSQPAPLFSTTHSRPYANPPRPPAKIDLVPSNNIARTHLYSNDTNNCDVVSSNKLISYYIRENDLDSALRVFHTMTDKTTVTWNSILAGFAKKREKLIEAKKLFVEIPEPDIVSFNTMLACYLNNSGVDRAREFFDAMIVRDAASWNTLISGYARAGRMCEAYELFLAMPVTNVVSWNAIVSGYVEAGELDRAAELFRLAPIKSVVAWTAMITGYMRNGNVEFAESLFTEMPFKNLVSWNATISGYVENGRGEDGLKFFKTMLELGVRPNASSLSSVLLGVSNLSALVLGKQVHQLVSKSPLYIDATSGTSLISMYCKCGDLEHAWKLFLEIPCKDVVTWNAMISGYAQHGAGAKALSLFDKMRGEGYQPDWITFVAVLSACNHGGLVDLGIQYFDTMRRDYRVEAKPEHYTCMIDLLGRSGRLSDAVDFIKKMPFKPHPAVFGTLLGACRIHKNTAIAEFAAANLISLEPASAAPYVQLANVYAAVNRWDHVARVRIVMKNSNVVKTPGCSWIEIKNVVHEFRSGDRIHSELACIHKKLHELEKKMRLSGYVPISEDALHNVDENRKGQLLLWHSEKLAIALGLLRMPPGTPIRVFKNLRVCGDCHLATKYISAIERREIIVRDTTRFHHFKDGICSCGEYW